MTPLASSAVLCHRHARISPALIAIITLLSVYGLMIRVEAILSPVMAAGLGGWFGMIPLGMWRDERFGGADDCIFRDVEAALDRDADALLTVLGENTRSGETVHHLTIRTSWAALWPRRWRRLRLDLPSGPCTVPAQRLPALASALRHAREQERRPGWRLLSFTAVCYVFVDLSTLSQHQRLSLARARS